MKELSNNFCYCYGLPSNPGLCCSMQTDIFFECRDGHQKTQPSQLDANGSLADAEIQLQEELSHFYRGNAAWLAWSVGWWPWGAEGCPTDGWWWDYREYPHPCHSRERSGCLLNDNHHHPLWEKTPLTLLNISVLLHHHAWSSSLRSESATMPSLRECSRPDSHLQQSLRQYFIIFLLTPQLGHGQPRLVPRLAHYSRYPLSPPLVARTVTGQSNGSFPSSMHSSPSWPHQHWTMTLAEYHLPMWNSIKATCWCTSTLSRSCRPSHLPPHVHSPLGLLKPPPSLLTPS